MKKIYETPDVTVLKFTLAMDVLSPSIESSQSSSAGGSIPDPDDPITSSLPDL